MNLYKKKKKPTSWFKKEKSWKDGALSVMKNAQTGLDQNMKMRQSHMQGCQDFLNQIQIIFTPIPV